MNERTLAGIVAAIGGLFCVLVLWSVFDPHAQIPVVSEIVCTVKGGSWSAGSPAFGIPAGCYERPGS